MYGYKNNNFHFYCYSIVIVIIIVIVIVVVLTCKRSQVSGNHRLSADHFPEVTSPSNASCAQYQHQERGVAISITIMMIYCLIHTYVPYYCCYWLDQCQWRYYILCCLLLKLKKTTLIKFLFLKSRLLFIDERRTQNIQTFLFSTPENWSYFTKKILFKIQVICDEKMHYFAQ